MNPIVENPFSWLYFPTALMLGALHALEPGHAKTLTAAYLIGIKGTKRDALLLGLSVAATHSVVVVGISVAALWLGRETFTADVTHWLQLGSGAIVVILGIWMLFRRIRQMRAAHDHQHEAPDPIHIRNPLGSGVLEIIPTADGERFRFRLEREMPNLALRVIIQRPEGLEVVHLARTGLAHEYLSDVPPNEPHEFSAEFELVTGDHRQVVPFSMSEPHGHDHSHMGDDEHARAHAADMPEYAKRGERPTLGQIIAFGAAGGMIPCPASITVMLLALSIGKFASGLLAVAGFSIGLAITLVGIGLIVVEGISRLHHTGRFHWISKKAPILSAGVVILSGVAALLVAH
jgi:nickel/cobalt exporter